MTGGFKRGGVKNRGDFVASIFYSFPHTYTVIPSVAHEVREVEESACY